MRLLILFIICSLKIFGQGDSLFVCDKNYHLDTLTKYRIKNAVEIFNKKLTNIDNLIIVEEEQDSVFNKLHVSFSNSVYTLLAAPPNACWLINNQIIYIYSGKYNYSINENCLSSLYALTVNILNKKDIEVVSWSEYKFKYTKAYEVYCFDPEVFTFVYKGDKIVNIDTASSLIYKAYREPIFIQE